MIHWKPKESGQPDYEVDAWNMAIQIEVTKSLLRRLEPVNMGFGLIGTLAIVVLYLRKRITHITIDQRGQNVVGNQTNVGGDSHIDESSRSDT